MKKLFLFALALAMTANVLAQFNPQTTPLTLEARDANTQVKVLNKSLGAFEYQINGQGTKQSIAVDAEVTIDLPNVGDYVQLWGNQATTCPANSSSNIVVPNGFAYMYGNIMSLVQNGASSFENLTELEGTKTFYGLFQNATALDMHPTKALVLPATTLSNSCYLLMFNGCTGLTDLSSMQLPALTVDTNAYRAMFYNCSHLTHAPQIAATTVKYQACMMMFYQCSLLTNVPDLHATTLGKEACNLMFFGCSSLQKAPAIPATTIDEKCCQSMFSNCTAMTTGPEILPATTLAKYCYVNMFYGCSQLAASPVLPAAQLAEGCYFQMFKDCSNLHKIECYATDRSATYCTDGWVIGVSNSGTFFKHSDFSGWPNRSDGYPLGWTLSDVTSNMTVNVDKVWYNLNSINLTATVINHNDYSSADKRPSVIPSSIEYNGHNYAVTAIGVVAFRGVNIGSITLPEGLESIGNEAFYNCSFSTIPTLLSTLKTIGNDAFNNNPNASGTLVIPANVESIGDRAFYNLSSLNAIDIQSTKLQTIGAYAFYGAKSNEITLPATITSIGNSAFQNVANLNKVTILATTPPTLYNEAGTFMDHNYMVPEIYVELASLNTYKSAWPSLASQIKANVAYTIIFQEYDGTELCSDEYGYMETPVSCDRNGKPSTTEHSYSFEGWMRQSTQTMGVVPAESDETYVATYSEQPRQYTITFQIAPEHILQTGPWNYGVTPTYNGETPVQGNKQFVGWSPEITQVNGDAVYTAVFNETLYQVTLANCEHGSIAVAETGVNLNAVAAGTVLHFNALPDEGYELDAWSGCNADGSLTVTANTTVSASFKKQTFVVTLVAEHGQIIVENEGIDLNAVEYGTALNLTPVPDEGYYFSYWHATACGAEFISSNTTITAHFNIRTFQVIFVDYDNHEISSQTVNYGEAAVAPADPEREGYRFIGWDQDFSSVIANMTIMAQYEQLPTGIEAVFSGENAAKILRNGQILILRGNRTYTLTGQEVR